MWCGGSERNLGLGGGAPWYGRSPYREALFFWLMLLGMAARYFTKAIEARRARIEALRKTTPNAPKPALEFDVWEFAYPFFASVVTFGALLSQINEPGDFGRERHVELQTGFSGRRSSRRRRKSIGH